MSLPITAFSPRKVRQVIKKVHQHKAHNHGTDTEIIAKESNSTTVDSRLSARGLTALRLNSGNVFLKKKFYFP
jgi:hypothetical protein